MMNVTRFGRAMTGQRTPYADEIERSASPIMGNGARSESAKLHWMS